MLIAIIGSGVVGSSLAFRLAQAGQQVVLIDRGAPSYGTTGSSFAWINANTKTPEDYFALNVAGMQAHRDLHDELGNAPWLHEGGNLVWVTSDEDAAELEARVARLHRWGYPAEWLDRDSMTDLEPDLRPEPEVEQAVLFPTEAWIDGPLLARRMAELAVDHGATLRYRSEVAGIERDGERITDVVLANGERIQADLVVNCAGPQADRIARLAGRTLPLAPTLGLIVRVSGGDGLINRVLHAPRVHMRPDADGLIVLHHDDADDAVGRGEAPNVWAEELLNRARQYVPWLAGARVSRWSIGVRPIPADERTSAGRVASLPGYAEVVTHSGITLGPLLARLVTEQIVNDATDPLLAPFTPDRF